jgi:TM2 domain-containing membrane protein YozV
MTPFHNNLKRTGGGIAVLIVMATLTLGPAEAQELGDPFSSDSVLRFAESLAAEGDYRRASGEFLRYEFLREGKPIDRRVLLEIAQCYRKLGEAEKAIGYLDEILAEVNDDESTLQAGYELAISQTLLGRYKAALSVLEAPGLEKLSDAFDPPVLRGWIYLLAGDWEKASAALSDCRSPPALDLAALAEEAKKLSYRSPALAGMASFIIPGAGKAYAGRILDGLVSLGLVCSLGALSVASFQREGIGSARGWTYGSCALLFHASNVYGSVVAAKQSNARKLGGIRARAMDFYASELR